MRRLPMTDVPQTFPTTRHWTPHHLATLCLRLPRPRGPSRITTGKVVQGRLDLNDVGLIENEIIQNLRADGGDVTISITISATKPDGFSESITRSVRENSAQLGLDFSTDSEA